MPISGKNKVDKNGKLADNNIQVLNLHVLISVKISVSMHCIICVLKIIEILTESWNIFGMISDMTCSLIIQRKVQNLTKTNRLVFPCIASCVT